MDARRKRRPKMCPNPLFVSWVEELRDQAKEKGCKSQYSYTKALNSLRKYPLPLSSGQEAKILDHVGEKVAKILDKRLAEHNSNKGDFPTGTASHSHGGVRKRADSATSSLTSVPISPPLPTPGSSSTSPPARKRSPDRKQAGPQEGSTGITFKLKKKRVPQEYIPVYRSGPYAILVALYNVEQRAGYRGYLTKAELITEAQPHCDASFTIPDPGSYYTTWSSMSSLVERGFVRRVKHPPRFSLTDAGVSLALRLIEGGAPSLSTQGQTTSSPLPPSEGRVATPTSRQKRRKNPSPSPLLVPSPPPPLKDSSPIVLGSSGSSSPIGSNTTEPYDLEDRDTMEWDSDRHWSGNKTNGWSHTPDAVEDVHHSGAGTPSPSLSPSLSPGLSPGLSPSLSSRSSAPAPALQFWYVSTDDERVRSKDRAAVTFNDDISVGFLIKCRKALLEESGIRYTTDPSRKADGQFVYVYLSNDDAPDRCSPPGEGGVADWQGGGGSSSSPPATSTRTCQVPNHSTASRTVAQKAVQTATTGGTRRVSPITLSDSDDSDVEVVPLAERIGWRGPPGDRGAGKGRSRSENTRTRASPTDSDTIHSGCVSNTGFDPCDRRPGIDGNRYGTGTPHQGLSPGQAAGLAALRRLQASRKQTAGSGSETSSPTTSAGGTHTGVCDLTDESHLEDSHRQTCIIGKEDTGTACRPTKKICSEKKQPLPALQRPVPTTHSHRTAIQGASRTSSDSSAPHRLSGSERSGTSVGCSASVDSSRHGIASVSTGHTTVSVDSLPRGTASASTSRTTVSVDSSRRGTASASTGHTSSSVESSRRGTASASTGSTAASLLSSAPIKASSRLVADEAVDLSNPEFVLRPGSSEVILCVDSSESTASRNSKAHFRGLLLQELGKNGVKYDVRRLHVGDFVWIAKERVAFRPGELGIPSSREVVLEYIVERKRMDDLAGSIIDGRFQEQKFRLTNCGIRNLVYLVEEHGEVNHAKLGERALEQAVANTQIINGFFVKRTKDIRESVAYLTIMTRYLQNHYAGKTIKAYPCDVVLQLNKMSPQNEDVCSMTFEKFNDASIKSKPPTVYEMFGRHLIQIPKSSADKAFAILEKYPTISHLREAYHQCETEKERENLLRDIKTGPNQRNLGPSLSSLICSLYWKGR